MSDSLLKSLSRFADEHGYRTKGPLCVALVVTQHAKKMGLPLDSNALLSPRGGQVLGLGKGAVQAVLNRHGITQVLASEGGRTSRGSIDNMRAYVEVLNAFQEEHIADLEAIEVFWVGRVREFFAGKPFKIKLDASRSLRTMVRGVIEQAIERQKKAPGTYYVGAVLQHLVGAKLEMVMGEGQIKHNSFSTADAPTQRSGDFLVEDVAIHVTASPSEAVIVKCKENIDDGLRPVLITKDTGVQLGQGLAENLGLGDRIDIFGIEQFVAFNVYERGRFRAEGRRAVVSELIENYNKIVDQIETDPSIRIEWKR